MLQIRLRNLMREQQVIKHNIFYYLQFYCYCYVNIFKVVKFVKANFLTEMRFSKLGHMSKIQTVAYRGPSQQ